MKAIAVIPARHGSTRFPGKPLVELRGKPMIQWVLERAALARHLDAVLVATDDERILQAVHALGSEAVLTSPDHASGTDRLAEVAESVEADVFVNVQGDEPLVEPATIDATVEVLLRDPGCDIATAAAPLGRDSDFRDPDVVKVVLSAEDEALYFSRAGVPWDASKSDGGRGRGALRHVGLYAYRRDALMRFCSLPPSRLEALERLEQLRALENGMKIRVARVPEAPPSVDRPEDVALVEAALREAESRGGRSTTGPLGSEGEEAPRESTTGES